MSVGKKGAAQIGSASLTHCPLFTVLATDMGKIAITIVNADTVFCGTVEATNVLNSRT